MSKRKVRVISTAMTIDILETNLKALSIMDDDLSIVAIKKVPEGFELTFDKGSKHD